jgi:hypothetical protein
MTTQHEYYISYVFQYSQLGNLGLTKLPKRAAKFFPKAKDWPPPDRQRNVSIAEMIAPKKKKLKDEDVKK